MWEFVSNMLQSGGNAVATFAHSGVAQTSELVHHACAKAHLDGDGCHVESVHGGAVCFYEHSVCSSWLMVFICGGIRPFLCKDSENPFIVQMKYCHKIRVVLSFVAFHLVICHLWCSKINYFGR
jgi:hypothetical protein